MAKAKDAGVFKMENGLWAYRFAVMIDGKQVARRKSTDEHGNKLHTKKEAIKAREAAIEQAHLERNRKKKLRRRTVKELYSEYCKNGRSDRAYQTIRKQDSLWDNHLCARFGNRYVDDISVGNLRLPFGAVPHRGSCLYLCGELFENVLLDFWASLLPELLGRGHLQ